MKRKKRRKFMMRCAARALMGAAILAVFFWAVAYAPIYEDKRVLLGVVLMAVSVICLFAASLLWYMGYDRLREDLKRDYGTRCFMPAPVMPEIPKDENSDNPSNESD